MDILKVVAPVFVLILLGMLCRQSGFLSDSGVGDMKKLVTRIILPVAIFHALATAEYSGQTALVVAVMFVSILISFGAGMLVRPLMKPPFRKYIPYMVSVYEGGMIAYPLFANLCGSEHLSYMAMLDIAGLLFGFSVYMGMLQQTEAGKPMDVRFMITDALHNPTFIATLAGIACGLTGWIRLLMESPAGPAYLAVEGLITAPLTTLILIVVGYSLKPDWHLLTPCLKTVALRAAVQAVFAAATALALYALVPGDRVLIIAVVTYMSAPATFSMQSFLKTEEASAYAATTNSLYCAVSLAVYTVMACLL